MSVLSKNLYFEQDMRQVEDFLNTWKNMINLENTAITSIFAVFPKNIIDKTPIVAKESND